MNRIALTPWKSKWWAWITPDQQKGLRQNQWSWYPNFSLSTDMKSIVGYSPVPLINNGVSQLDFAMTAPAMPDVELPDFFALYLWVYAYDNAWTLGYWVVYESFDVNSLTSPLSLLPQYPIWATVLFECGIINPTGWTLTTGIDWYDDWLEPFQFPRSWATLHSSQPPVVKYVSWWNFQTVFETHVGAINNIGNGTSLDDGFVQWTITQDWDTQSFPFMYFDSDYFIMSSLGTQSQDVLWLISITNNTWAPWERGVDSFDVPSLGIEIINYEARHLGSYNDLSELAVTRIVPFDWTTAWIAWVLHTYRDVTWAWVGSWWISVPPTVSYLTGWTTNTDEAEFGTFQEAWDYLETWLIRALPKTMYVKTSFTHPVIYEWEIFDNIALSIIGNMSSSNMALPATLSVNNSSHWPWVEMQRSLPSNLEGIQLLLNSDNAQWQLLWAYNWTPFDIQMTNSLIENSTSAHCYDLANWSYRMTLRGRSWLVCTSWALFSISSFAFLRVDLYDDSYLSWQINQSTITPDQLEIHVHSPNVKLSDDYVNGINCKIIFHTFTPSNIAQFTTKGYGNIATTTDTIVDATWDDVNKQMTIEVWVWPVANIANVWDRVNIASLLMTNWTADWTYMYVTSIDIGNDTMTVQFPMSSIDFGAYVSWGTVTKQDVRSIGYIARECTSFNWKMLYECTGLGNHLVILNIFQLEQWVATVFNNWTIVSADNVFASGSVVNDWVSNIRAAFMQQPTNTGRSMNNYYSSMSLNDSELLLIMDAPNDDEITIKTLTVGN